MALTVIKPFVYDGKAYARGDVWEPAGHRTDRAIVAARMVVASEDAGRRVRRGKPRP